MIKLNNPIYLDGSLKTMKVTYKCKQAHSTTRGHWIGISSTNHSASTVWTANSVESNMTTYFDAYASNMPISTSEQTISIDVSGLKGEYYLFWHFHPYYSRIENISKIWFE